MTTSFKIGHDLTLAQDMLLPLRDVPLGLSKVILEHFSVHAENHQLRRP